jgi:cytochrome bd-type quinol oxidase subunit 2
MHAKTIWNIVHIATGLYPPRSISHMLGNWLTGIARERKKSFFVGVVALIWAI